MHRNASNRRNYRKHLLLENSGAMEPDCATSCYFHVLTCLYRAVICSLGVIPIPVYKVADPEICPGAKLVAPCGRHLFF